MYGFVVTTHYDNYDTIKKCLDLLFNSIPEESYVVLYLNEPKGKVVDIEQEYTEESNRFTVITIEDQRANGGLTGTWNQGIDYLLSLKDLQDTKYFDCKVITIIGHDTFVNRSIIHLLEAGKKAQENDEFKYFGPLFKSFPGKSIELWQDEKEYKNHEFKFIVGSAMTFPINTLIKNKLTYTNNENYFNAKWYPFGGNEIDWHKRFILKKGIPEIITDCIINHECKQTWKVNDKNINRELLTEEDKVDAVKEKFDELKFNWINYLKKNPDLKNKGIKNEIQALNHYMSVGKNQGRTF